MRYLRLVLVPLLLGVPVIAAPIGVSPVSAEPFSYSSVSVGKRNACAISNDGVLLCWGDNSGGWIFSQHPSGPVPTPTRIALPHNQKWKSVDVGDSETICGLSASHRAWCWGNHHLGSYFTPTSRTPVEVEFPAGVTLTDVQSGSSVACATTSSQQLWCWGDAHYLGDGGIDPVRTPVHIPMPDNAPIARFNVGVLGVCAVTTTPNMYCWGSNRAGELGLGFTQQHPYSYSWTPIFIAPPTGEQWAQAVFGLEHICAITVSGSGYCAGRNYEGAFGNGTFNHSHRFTKMLIPNDEKITSLATGWYHTCVLTESGSMLCAGRGSFGELGTGTTLGGRTWRTPSVPNGVRFTSFNAGVAGTCALDTQGKVWCWGGLNWGSQGTGQVNSSLFPQTIAPVGSPTILSLLIPHIDGELATVNGAVNPNGYNTTALVELSSSSDFAQSRLFPISVSFPNNSYQSRQFSLSMNSLDPRTTYYIRTIATNVLGRTTSPTESFITLGEEPNVSSVETSHISGNEASVSVIIHPHRLTTSAFFEWSTDPSFSENVFRRDIDAISGNSPTERTAQIGDLAPNTTYFLRASATNKLGTAQSSITSFTTLGSPPVVTLASHWASTTVIHATSHIDTGFISGSTYLEVSTSPSFSDSVRSVTRHYTGNGPNIHEFVVDGLAPMTNYWLRVVAENSLGRATSAAVNQRTAGDIATIRINSVSANYNTAIAQLDLDTTGLNTFVTLQLSENADMSDATEYFLSSTSTPQRSSPVFTLDNLTARTNYFLTATTRNQAGIFETDVFSFTTLTPLGVLINNDDNDTSSTEVELSITAPSDVVALRISNRANFVNAKVISPTSSMTWELIASNELSAKRTVYVQVYLSNGKTFIYSDSITLRTSAQGPDRAAPVIHSLKTVRSSSQVQSSRRNSSTVSQFRVAVRDRRSGVNHIELRVGNRKIVRRVEATRRGSFAIEVPQGALTIRVRVRDAAGNFSKWKTLRIR